MPFGLFLASPGFFLVEFRELLPLPHGIALAYEPVCRQQSGELLHFILAWLPSASSWSLKFTISVDVRPLIFPFLVLTVQPPLAGKFDSPGARVAWQRAMGIRRCFADNSSGGATAEPGAI